MTTFNPSLRAIFFASGLFSLGFVYVALRQRDFNEVMIQKYLAKYSVAELKEMDRVLMEEACE